MIDWGNINYLQSGNKRQQEAFAALSGLNIMFLLKEYEPILVGTIPIEIDIPESDLDIICYTKDLVAFQGVVHEYFRKYHTFFDKFSNEAYIAKFYFCGFEFEIFAQPVPTRYQYAYRHMLIEYKILNLAGQRFKNEIIQLKQNGYKTEPAFGKLLKLNEPFSELIELENWSDKQLIEFVRKRYKPD